MLVGDELGFSHPAAQTETVSEKRRESQRRVGGTIGRAESL